MSEGISDWLETANALANQGRWEEAIRAYQKDLKELGPGRWEVHMSLGRAYMNLGRDKEAIGQLQEVLRLAPSEAAQAYELLGEIFARKKGRSVETTVVWFRHAGQQYLKRGLANDAVRVYKRILDLKPDDEDALRALRAEGGRNAPSSGKRKQEEILHLRQATDSLNRGAVDEAVGSLQQLLQIEPDSVLAREMLAEIYLGKGIPSEARKMYQQAVELVRASGDEQAVASFQRRLDRLPEG